MKQIFSVVTLFVLFSCSSPKDTTNTTTVTRTSTTTSQAMEPPDSVIYYRTEIEFDQKDYLPQMMGTWSIRSMQRQTMLPLETLQNVSLSLLSDGKLSAKTDCGTIAGSYSVKGMSIKFNDLRPSWNNCNNSDQLNEMVRLLQNTVSMYTIEGNQMTLRDNSSNIIFSVNR